LVSIVALANTYSNIFEIGTSGDPFPDELVVTYLLENAGISWSALSGLSQSVLDEIEKARIFLQVVKGG
jgi:hypothetical protein